MLFTSNTFSLCALILLQGWAYNYGAYLEPKRSRLLMISFDGLRSKSFQEFLDANPNSNFHKYFINVGVIADYMIPSFPSLTFPNHYTLITGLYPESTGIIGNSFYDPYYKEKANLLSGEERNDERWWNKTEPIWLTAKKQGLKTASYFWTGSEVWPQTPDVYVIFDPKVDFKRRCDEIVNWFQKLNMDFITLYFDEPDAIGHEFGPESVQYQNKIKEIDTLIGYLMSELAEINGLLENLNIVIVSDHGMASMNNKTYVIKDVLDINLINQTRSFFGVVSHIYPKNINDTQKVYDSFKKLENFSVYFKDEVPKSFHFDSNERIAPIVVVADEGYVLLPSKPSKPLMGNHGFNNSIESMRAIFLARGPDFKKQIKLRPFENVNVYPLLCNLLEIDCKKHNGSVDVFKTALKNEVVFIKQSSFVNVLICTLIGFMITL